MTAAAESCYDLRMKLVLAMALVVAACSGPKPKPESPIVDEVPEVPETCCCKHNPLTSDDGKPVFGMANRMECSTRQGECVPDVQCQATQPAEPPAPSG